MKFKLLFRDFQFHPLIWILSIFGIAVGVAGWVGMKSATDKAGAAFYNSMKSTVGNATHLVKNQTGSVDEDVYRTLARSSQTILSPVLEDYARLKISKPDNSANTDSPQYKTVRILGIDPVTFFYFRDLQSNTNQNKFPLDKFITGKRVMIIPEEFSKYTVNNQIELEFNSSKSTFEVATTLTDKSATKTIYMDISALQKLRNRSGELSKILVRSKSENPFPNLDLGPNIQVQKTGTHTQSISAMLSAYQWNLHALAFLSLFVGAFLVYSSMVLYSNRQQNIFSLFRTLGLTSTEVFTLSLYSVLTLGVTGSVLGIFIGYLMSNPVGKMVLATVERSFAPVFGQGGVSYTSLLLGLLLGVGVTLLGGLGPLWRNWNIGPREWQLKTDVHNDRDFTTKYILQILIAGLSLSACAFMLVIFSSGNVIAGYLACFFLSLSGSILTCLVIPLIGRIPWPGQWILMASRNLRKYPMRSSVMVGSLVAAFSMVLAVTIMVDSFRGSVKRWAGGVLKADYFVQTAPGESTEMDPVIPNSVIKTLREIDGVKAVAPLRKQTVETSNGNLISIHGINSRLAKKHNLIRFNSSLNNPRKRLAEGEIFLSEPGAYRLKKEAGDFQPLPIPDKGTEQFRIAGVFNDYSPKYALVYMQNELMKKLYPNSAVRDLAVYLSDSKTGSETRNKLKKLVSKHELFMQSNRELKSMIMRRFNKNFAVTNLMRLIAGIVAVVGLMVTLISFNRTRIPLFGRLRASGTSRFQLMKMVSHEGILLGFISLIGAIPTGYCLSYLLIEVVNRRTFGWTIHMNFSVYTLLELTLLLAISVCIGLLYPILKIYTDSLPDLLREGKEFVR